MTMTSETIRPLTNSQKLFLQRLLVSHVLTDEKAKDLYQSIRDKFANVGSNNQQNNDDDDDDVVDQGYMGNNFEHCLGIINASLIPAFNLEIATVSLPPAYDRDGNGTQRRGDGGQNDESDDNRKSSTPSLLKYHAIVNRSNDEVAKNYAAARTALGPHEIAYVRKVLEKLVECGNEFLEGYQKQQQEEGNSRRRNNRIPIVGCVGSLNKMELINLRTEMEGPHKDKLSIAQTELALEMMESEGWLVPVAPPGGDDDDDDDSNNDADDKSGEGEQPKKKRKRKSSRKSLRGTFYGVGPRSFMELGEFLQNCGFPEERMPQSILHRN